MSFDLSEFLTPLDPWVIAMALLIGIVMGFRMRQLGPRMSRSRVFWQIVDGFVFFVPLAAIRAFEGSDVWERLLGTLPLWIIYISGMRLGNSFEWDRLPGNRDRKQAPRERPETRERRRTEIDHPLFAGARVTLAPVGKPKGYTGPRRRADDYRSAPPPTRPQ